MSRNILRELVLRFLSRPLVKELLEEYILESSPLIKNYVKRIAEITGLPEEVVKRSQPVRNYIKRILGES